MANIEASNYQGDNNWALLLDPDGFVAEGTGDNFFIVKDNVIVTPEPRNILRGVSRAHIFELSQELNLRCIENNIEPYDVMMADEAFMTGTPFCILPVSSLNSIPIGKEPMGIVTRRLLDAWSSEVEVDIVGQIKRWDAESEERVSSGATPYSFKTADVNSRKA